MHWYEALGIAAALTGGQPSTAPVAPERKIYACGDDQVREYRVSAGSTSRETWRWRAAEASDLPEAYRTSLLTRIDECKPVDDGRSILVTASTGGVALIDRASGRVSFRANAPMAHSADLLPGGLIAVALSIHRDGNRLELYDRRRSEVPLQNLPLPSGHGAVWDTGRQRLFALSHDIVQAFRIAGTRAMPKLVETSRWMLPGRRDGHDLSRRPDGRYLVTTDDCVWTFDPGARHKAGGAFAALPALNPKLRVKAVAMAGSGAESRLAWVQAEESWWAKGFTVARADGSDPVRTPVEGMHLYKVRWIP